MGMTTNEWNIYNDIKQNTLEGKWTSVEELATKYEVGKRTIRQWVHNIKNSDTIQKIIISSCSGNKDYGYKILTEEEEKDYLIRKQIKLLKMLKQNWKDIDRFNKNGQCKITFGDYERGVYESIMNVGGKKK